VHRFFAALCVVAVAAGCAHGAPNSLFEESGYHVRGDTVYCLNGFPGKTFEITGADPTTFPPGRGATGCTESFIAFQPG
jgi:hypothetical protein